MAVVQKKSKSVLILSIVCVLLLLGVGVLGYLYYTERQDTSELQNKVAELESQVNRTPEQEVQELVQEVGELYQLPEGETPVVATVEDITKFENQPFFENAQNGDKLLIYYEAKQAFLYRPSTQKIINSGPLAESAAESTPQSGATQPTEATTNE